MTDAELSKLRALCEAATPGEWIVHRDPHTNYATFRLEAGVRIIDCGSEANAVFIAAAREALPAALDEIERLQTRQDELLALVAKLSQTVPLESEVSAALDQRGALLAEVGTLRAEVARWKEFADRERVHAKMFAGAADTEKADRRIAEIDRAETRATLATVEKERDELRTALRWVLLELEDEDRDVKRENELRALVYLEPLAKEHSDAE